MNNRSSDPEGAMRDITGLVKADRIVLHRVPGVLKLMRPDNQGTVELVVPVARDSADVEPCV